MNYSAEALGQVVRGLREQMPTKMSQEGLGLKADYGKGAGVSISRIESGQTLPTRAKLAGIAGGLGVTVERLEELATQRTDKLAAELELPATPTPKARTTKERALTVDAHTRARIEKIDELTSAYHSAHRLARDEFFLPFVEWAGGIQGVAAPPIPAEQELTRLAGNDGYTSGAVVEVASRSVEIVKVISAGLGGVAAGAASGAAAAYATYTSVELLGRASTGVPISSLAGVARSNATLAVVGGGTLASGGGGMAAGTTVLTALVALPIVLGGIAAGAYLVHRRNKSEEAKQSTQLDAAEAKLQQMKPGFDLLVAQLPKATGTLDYIGTHAAHSFKRWAEEVGDLPRSWDSLPDDQKRRYNEFVEIAACEAAIDGIDTAQFMTTEGEQLQEFAAASAAILKHTDSRARTLV
ncbi:MAG: helix-turn-helix domain-containing protein [Leucobacter sp.]